MKVFACYTNPNDIENTNNVKYLRPTLHQEMWNRHYRFRIHLNTSNFHPLYYHSFFYIPGPHGTDFINLNIPPCCHISISYIMGFDIKVIHKINRTTCLYASCCHHYHYIHFSIWIKKNFIWLCAKFVSNKHEDLSNGQRRFLVKHIPRNSVFEAPDPKFELHVQAMIDTSIQECKLDDSIHLEMIPSMLKMTIGHKKLVTFTDMEGRKDKCLVWVLQESKHTHD